GRAALLPGQDGSGGGLRAPVRSERGAPGRCPGPATIGHDCIVGEKTYIAYVVEIGNFVKINAMVYIPTGIPIADRVMIAAGVIFTNDRYPRAFDDHHGGLAPSGPTEETVYGRVAEGATIGAGAR